MKKAYYTHRYSLAYQAPDRRGREQVVTCYVNARLHETIGDEKAKGFMVPASSRVQVGSTPFMWGFQVKRNMIGKALQAGTPLRTSGFEIELNGE
jgi:hypothetical protein